MAVTDLTNTTWLINSAPGDSGTGSSEYYDITLTSNSTSFVAMVISGQTGVTYGYDTPVPGEYGYVPIDLSWETYGWGYWDDMSGSFTSIPELRTITITGGTDVTNSALISWLQSNATQIGPVPSIIQNLFIGQPKMINGYLGNARISQIYYGNTLVWEREQVPVLYTITTIVTHGTYSGATYIETGETGATVTLSADDNYLLPSSITVSGASYTYDSSNGRIVLTNFTGNVTISATCEEGDPGYITFSSPSSFTLATANTTKNWNGTLYYSTNKTTWSTWNGTSISSGLNGNNYVIYMRGRNNTKITGNSNTYRWVFTGSNINCSGNIENLLDYTTVANGNHPTMAEYCYYFMFYNCTSLTTTPALSAITLSKACYCGMFYGCTSLTTALALPATALVNNCYESMFNGCTSLVIAPTLSATTLGLNCCYSMFYGCTNLLIAPTLSATTLAEGCYSRMFYECTSLTTAPTLNATTLRKACYESMFYGCTSLTTAPTLPATTLADSCYQGMFGRCTSLTTAPVLNAMTAPYSCYSAMFSGCTSLTTAPALPATTLSQFCYANMFKGCTSLTTAPALNATTLVWYCYWYMFSGCTSLTTAPDLPATIISSYCYECMFQNCTSLTAAPALPAPALNDYCYRYMFQNCTSLTRPAKMAGGTIQAISAKQCCYQMYAGCTSLNIYTSSSGHRAFYKALTYSTSSSDSNYQSSYAMFYNCKINGSISTATYLTAGTQYYCSPPPPSVHSVEIYNNTNLDNVNIYDGQDNTGTLLGTILMGDTETYTVSSGYLYAEWDDLYITDDVIFAESGSDIGNPIEVTSNMSIEVWGVEPVVPYLTFSSPNSFTLSVVDNTKYWNGTIQYSTNTTTWYTWAGTSAISSGVSGNNNVLYLRGIGNTYITGSGASSSTKHWVLTGSNISCSGNIENLLDYTIVVNRNHPPMANYCYYYMFYDCASLITAPQLPATTLATYCYYYMFSKCTSLTAAPSLPATTLAGSCYHYMFNRCTSLTTISSLPATILASNCYHGMFNWCTNIKLSTTQTGNYQTIYRIPTSGTGTTNVDALLDMFASTGGTFSGSPSINTTYYTSNTVV